MADEKVSLQSPMQAYAGSIVLLTSPEDELYRLELTLRNVKIVKGEIVQISKPWLNEDGVLSCIGLLRAIVTRNTILGDLSDKEISKIILGLADTLIKDLMVNARNYEIKNIATRDKIMNSCLNLACLTLKRAQKGGERRFWKGSQQEVTYRQENSQKQKGFFERLRGES